MKAAWKKYALIYLVGALTPLALCVYLGGERLAVMGFRLSALENGVKLARSEWTVDGVPALQSPVAVAEAAESPAGVTTRKAGARRR